MVVGEEESSSVAEACWGLEFSACFARTSCCCVSLGGEVSIGVAGRRGGAVILLVSGDCVVKGPEVGVDHAVELILPDLLVCGVVF